MEYSDKVTYMKFMAHPKYLWKFILLATERAKTDHHLAHIAAGLIERLLAKHGTNYIEAVEDQAANNLKFARMLTGARKYSIDNEIWLRVQRLQKPHHEKLATARQHNQVIEFEERHLNKLKQAYQRKLEENSLPSLPSKMSSCASGLQSVTKVLVRS